ncbi:hypothetical protein, partial [uncultured Clostridium sp.]|uniref:hypothetical protein n=1 Tax=uncultured Clostridium sp. TaxID=59620 RepID=UPI00272C785E
INYKILLFNYKLSYKIMHNNSYKNCIIKNVLSIEILFGCNYKLNILYYNSRGNYKDGGRYKIW